MLKRTTTKVITFALAAALCLSVPAPNTYAAEAGTEPVTESETEEETEMETVKETESEEEAETGQETETAVETETDILQEETESVPPQTEAETEMEAEAETETETSAEATVKKKVREKTGSSPEQAKRDPVTVDSSMRLTAGADRIHIIKVFQGDNGNNAVLAESNGHFAMFDVGTPYRYNFTNSKGEKGKSLTCMDHTNAVVNYLKSYGVEKLDFIAITHFDNDHVGNMQMLLRTFDVDKVYARTFNSPNYQETFPSRPSIEEVIDGYGVQKETLTDGQVLSLGNLTVKVFNLDDDLKTVNYKENDNSAIFLITDRYGHKALLTGDLNNRESMRPTDPVSYDPADLRGDETRLVAKHEDELSDLDYFQPGHHGNVLSSSRAFIQMVNPTVIAVTGSRITTENDPLDGAGNNTVLSNYNDTPAMKNGQVYTMHDSANGVAFTMGKTMSINTVYTEPCVDGKGKNTLSLYYQPGGGSIDPAHSGKYKIDTKQNRILSLVSDAQTCKDFVQQDAINKGDITPMYYFDKARSIPDAGEFGLVRKGYRFGGAWASVKSPGDFVFTDNKYSAPDLVPAVKDKNVSMTLTPCWVADGQYKAWKAQSKPLVLNEVKRTTYTGQTLQLYAKTGTQSINPSGLKWKSSAAAIASVDSTGKVTAQRYGTAKITVTTADGKYTAVCTVQVKYKDVKNPKDYWYAPVYQAANKGITKGYNGGEYFGPEKSCSREEMITFLWRAYGKPQPKKRSVPLSDVPKNAYYTKAVCWAYEKGIAKGYTSGPNKGKFGVGLPVSREDAILFLYRAAGSPAVSAADQKKYTYRDVKANEYYSKAVSWAVKNGIAKGYTSGQQKGKFGISRKAVRKDVITWICRETSSKK